MSDLTNDAEVTDDATPSPGTEAVAVAAPEEAPPTEAPVSEAAAQEAVAEAPQEAPAEEAAEAAVDEAPAEESVEDVAAEETGDEAAAEQSVEEVAAASGSEVVAAAGTEEAKDVAVEAAAEAAAEAVAEVAGEAEASEVSEEAPAEAAEEVTAEAEAAKQAPAAEAAAETAEVSAEATAGEEAPAAEAADASEEDSAKEVSAEGAETGLAVPPPLVASEQAPPGDTMAALEQALEAKTPVKGQIIGWNKGGYHVVIGKIAAFCPVSQIEVGKPCSPKRYLDKSFPFLVIDIQEDGRRVVVSRSAALAAERETKAALVREHLKPGAKLEGKVSSLTDFGAFVNLGGGIEGLVHVSELSRRRVDHPKELLKKGQKVDVQVLKIEKNGERISLSMKRLEADPWAGVAERHPVGSAFTGTVLRKADFGVFIEVEPGLEGLVHTSRLPLGVELSNEQLDVGKEVSGWIHEVERKRRRLSLSLREVAKGNPWRGVTQRFPEGEIAKGTVERLTNFGAFIELEPGLTGLLPFSQIPGAGNPRRQYHAGKEVSVRVLSIDRDKRRISLGTEASQAEGSVKDYRDYQKAQKRQKPAGGEGGGGLTALAAAFAKAKDKQ